MPVVKVCVLISNGKKEKYINAKLLIIFSSFSNFR